MASLWQQYTDEIYNECQYWGIWQPSVHIELGACGPVEDRVFRPQGRLRDYDIQFEVTEDPTPADTDYSSTDGLDIVFKAKGETKDVPDIPAGKAGVHIGFNRTEAVVIATKGARQPRISDQEKLRRDLLKSVVSPDGGIPERWFVVTDLVQCDFASVIVARGSKAAFAVSAEADFQAGLVDIANAELDLSVRKESNVGFKMLAQQGATPLFRGMRLKRTFLGDLEVENLGPDDGNSRSDEEIREGFEPLSPKTADSE